MMLYTCWCPLEIVRAMFGLQISAHLQLNAPATHVQPTTASIPYVSAANGDAMLTCC